MEMEITITRYNVGALLGWAGLFVGAIAGIGQYFYPTPIGFAALIGSLVCSGITVTFAGPIKTVTKKQVTLK